MSIYFQIVEVATLLLQTLVYVHCSALISVQ
jgi:hypothetical protein